MLLLRPNLLINDAFGSAGDVTAYHRGGKCFLRKKSTLKYADTPAQVAASSVHLKALQAWRGLEHSVQLQWNEYGNRVEPHRPPFDHKARISGNNLFVSAYHGFATLGVEHVPVPVPVPFEAFPTFLVKILGASAVDDVLQIRWKLEAVDPGSRYRLLTKIQLARPGAGRSPGKMINYLAEGSANDPSVTSFIPGYKVVSGLDLDAYQVHARCILLDTKTGYRSQYLAISSQFQIA
jgi:hypothetical protein